MKSRLLTGKVGIVARIMLTRHDVADFLVVDDV